MDQTLNFLKELVAIPSSSGNEQAMVEHIKKKLVDKGELQAFDNSLILKIKGENSQKAIIFNGHIDTVPASDLWTKDPFKLTIEKDKAYGLGVSDMKSGLAIMLSLVEKYTDQQPPVDLLFMFVENEETDGRGTKKVLENLPDLNRHYPIGVEGVILEPTDASYIGIGHKGNVFINLVFEGQGGHGSEIINPELRAVAKMSHFVNELQNISASWVKKYTDRHLGKPTINVTSVKSLGSEALNAVPEAVTMTLDIRTTPKLSSSLTEELKALAKKFVFKFSMPYEPTGYGLCDPNSKVLKIVKSQVGPQNIQIFQGASDQLFFTAKNIPMIIFGPGTNAVMHHPNEFVELKKIEKCQAILEDLIEKY